MGLLLRHTKIPVIMLLTNYMIIFFLKKRYLSFIPPCQVMFCYEVVSCPSCPSSCPFVFWVSQPHAYISFQLCMRQCHGCTKQQLFISPIPSCFEIPAWDAAESLILRASVGVTDLSSCPGPANVPTSFTMPPPHHCWCLVASSTAGSMLYFLFMCSSGYQRCPPVLGTRPVDVGLPSKSLFFSEWISSSSDCCSFSLLCSQWALVSALGITSRHEKPAQAPLSPPHFIRRQGKCQLVPAVLDCLLQGREGVWIRPPSRFLCAASDSLSLPVDVHGFP